METINLLPQSFFSDLTDKNPQLTPAAFARIMLLFRAHLRFELL